MQQWGWQLNLATWVQQLYGLTDVSLHSLHSPSGKYICVVQSHNQKWVLRVFPPGNDELSSVVDLLLLFEQTGYAAERIMRTIDNLLTGSIDKWTILVTTFVEGVPLNHSADTLRQLGVSLGRLHSLSPQAHLPTAQMRPRNEIAYATKQLESVFHQIPASLVHRYDELLGILHSVDFCEDLPHVIIHNDCHPGNAVYTPQNEVVLIDWEGAGLGSAVLDVGFLLVSSDGQAPWDQLSIHDFKPDAELVQSIVDGYCQHRVLSSIELERLPDAIRFRSIVYGACSFAEKITKGSVVQDAEWWSTRLTIADELATIARKHFQKHL